MDTLSPRDMALIYAHDIGWPIFPVSRGKRPLVDDWPNVATTDPIQVYAWWTRWPRANFGHPTGLIFDALDVDSMAARVRLEDVCTRIGHAFTGPIVRTGRGWQMYYEPTGLGNLKPRNEDGSFMAGVDFRGAGGYVILPGSVHANGRTYEWLRQRPLPVMPATLRQALWPARAHEPIRSVPPVAPSDPDRLKAWAWAGLQGIVEELANIPARRGLRNDALNRLGFRAFQLAHALGEEEVEAAVMAAAEANGYVGDHGLARTLSTVRSAKAGLGQPRFPGGK